MKKVNSTIFYVAVVIAVLNSVAFVVEGNWTAFLFFLLTVFATYSIKPDGTIALVSGVVVSNLYRAIDGVQEGMETKNPKDSLSPSETANTSASNDSGSNDTANTKKKTTQPDTTGLDDDNMDKDIDDVMGDEGFQNLMNRQTKLMQNMKNMQPMIAQAKNMLNALPKGFVKQALQQFKLKQK
jgi:hypothetical protein